MRTHAIGYHKWLACRQCSAEQHLQSVHSGRLSCKSVVLSCECGVLSCELRALRLSLLKLGNNML